MKTFKFFFNDYMGNQMAPNEFIDKVLTQLDNQLYKPDEVIIRNK